MAQVIKVNIKETKNKVEFEQENIPVDDIENKTTTAHLLLSAHVCTRCRIPDVGEKVSCKKQPLYTMGYDSVAVTNTNGTICGYIISGDNDALHGTIMDEDRFNALPDTFVGTVVEIGRSSLNANRYLMMIALECSVKPAKRVFTVVSPGCSLLASYGSIFTAVKEKRFSGNANIFAVYDGQRKIGIIAPKSRVALPDTEALTFMESIGYPDSFKVRVVGDGCYDGTNHAIKVEPILTHEIPKLTAEEIAEIDRQLLKKYVCHLFYNGEWSMKDQLMLSEKGHEKKTLLDEKYKEVMQHAKDKMLAYCELL